MTLGSITKQPYEVLDRYLDFAAEIHEGVTIELDSLKAVLLGDNSDSTEKMIGSNPAPSVSGTKVVFWIQNGADGEHHKITVKVIASDGQHLEGDIDLFVVER